jgi:hypothetical protein
MENITCSPWSFSANKDGAGFGLNLSFFGFKVPNVTNMRIVPEYGMNSSVSVRNGMLITEPDFKERWWRLTIETIVHKDETAADIPRLHDSIKDEVHERLMARIIELEEENVSLKRKKKK